MIIDSSLILGFRSRIQNVPGGGGGMPPDPPIAGTLCVQLPHFPL